jgi:hypothetical protein
VPHCHHWRLHCHTIICHSHQDSTFLSTISTSLYIDSNCSYGSRPRVMTMLSHAAKLRNVLESAGVDIVLPLQEFKYNLLG